MNILVTGFEPFGNDCINPSQEILSKLPKTIGAHKVDTLVIPTVAYRSLEAIELLCKKVFYDRIISLGLAKGSSSLALEAVGINLNEFRMSDNEGVQLKGTPVFEDGPDAYLVKLPLKAMLQAVQKVNVPARISYSAGTFVCNHVLYGVSHLLAKNNYSQLNGFVHVPALPSQVVNEPNMPSMSLDDMVRGIVALLGALDVQEDVKLSCGSLY